jgi:hypothetical protein
MEKNYKQAKMVNWYMPRMLLSVGMKAVISGTFGNYADRRELEAALESNADNEHEWKKLRNEYCSKDDIWIDVVSDTGDGFNSTFAIAKSVAAPSLEFEYKDENDQLQKVPTQRGKILIFGGDEVYPFPTLSEYTNRFKIPFASASDDFTEIKKEKDRPHLYAIPGNHDWYDGLGNFIKLFCQQRWIGIWSTQQHRSYFALPLPNNYWIWATDIQLNSDIDKPQLNYFETIARTKMSEGDIIILVTAEPAWVYKQIHKNDRSFDKLQFFIDNYVHNKNECTGKNFRLAATLTGDLHHYARYCSRDCLQGHQYITAGGGGAFLHLTHNLPQKLTSIYSEKDIHQQQIFPDRKEAHKLLLGNFLFPFKNSMFTFLFLCIYLFYFWIIQESGVKDLYNSAKPFSFVYNAILNSPFLIILTLGLGAGFYAFADTNVLSKAARGTGIAHAILQVILLILVMYCLGVFFNHENYSLTHKLLMSIISCLSGSIVAAFFMGTYLYFSNRLFNMHINEASSSLACPNYKNFLRLHIHTNGVTIYPVGIKKVPTNWETNYNEKEDIYSFKGNPVETFLIEKPIQILNDQL